MNNSSKKCIPSTRAFTLVELMVVIAIIALLVSMLTPAVMRARATGEQSACLGKVRKITQAILMYASANEGKFPYVPSNDIPDTWEVKIAEYLGYTYTRIPRTPTPKIYYCPTARADASQYEYLGQGDYGMNRVLMNLFNSYEFIRLSMVTHAKDTMLISDYRSGYKRNIYNEPFLAFTDIWRHQNGINVGYVDGHAEWISFTNVASRGYLEWKNWRYGWRDGLIY